MGGSEEVFGFDSYNLFLCALIVVGYQLVGFTFAYSCTTDKLTDLFGATNYVILQAVLLFVNHDYSARKVVTCLLVALWGVRLSGYLFMRILNIGADKRFDDLHDFFPFLGFWIFQMVWVFVVSLPATFIAGLDDSDVPIRWYDVVAWVAVVAGVALEAAADQQKFAFRNKRENDGRFCNTGVWAVSRHPNYFGELLVWWAVFASGMSVYHVSPGTWSSIASPVLITLLLLFISGLPMLEKSADKRYGHSPGFKDYKESTPILVPFPPALYRKCSPSAKAIFCCEYRWYADADVTLGTVTSSTSLTSADEEAGQPGTYSGSYESVKTASSVTSS